MASLYDQAGKNVFRTWVLMTAFLVLVVAIGWGVSYYLDEGWILYLAIGIALVMNIYAYWFSDRVAIRSARAKPADPTQYRALHRIVENLAITAGLPKPRVYIIEDPAPNAFSAGRDKKHAVIAVTTGCLSMMDENELQGVIAHELSHVGNRDILVMTAAVVLVGVLSVLANIFLRVSIFGGLGGDRGRNQNPIAIIAVVGAMILAPLAATLIELAISRKREYLADASGALLTRYPEGLENALRKIGSYNAPMQHASTATAHLFIANPFGSHPAGQWIQKLFSTHPPIPDRIAALEGMNV